uniref:Putative ovule protein n=1 Tax=Solanum chacoense TaxID=4108 RepID=A0A0V0GSR0_SOLCH
MDLYNLPSNLIYAYVKVLLNKFFRIKYSGIEIAMLSYHFSILSLVVLKYLQSSFNLSFDSTYGEPC